EPPRAKGDWLRRKGEGLVSSVGASRGATASPANPHPLAATRRPAGRARTIAALSCAQALSHRERVAVGARPCHPPRLAEYGGRPCPPCVPSSGSTPMR